MAEVTPEDVKDIAPELSTLDDEVIQRYIRRAERRINRAAWGRIADDGVTYLTAHLLTLRAKGAKAAAGPVASVSVGSVSQSYAVQTATDGSNYNSTAYGREYLSLRANVFASRVL